MRSVPCAVLSNHGKLCPAGGQTLVAARGEEYHILPQPSPPIMCVQYECCMGQFPFDAQNEGALIRKILKGAYAPIVA